MAANDMIRSVQHPTRGEVKMLGMPVKLKKTPGAPKGPSPLLGEHTEEILLGLGYSKSEISSLEADGIIKTIKKAT
jgi:crotonobetainyl-CoA:carnitine CoA-transferase CaiB-like acyl-CoA transferase